MPSLLLLALLGATFIGCAERPADRQEPPTKPSATPTAEPIACKADGDCPPLSCGPCTPGEVVRRTKGVSMDCAQNPCIGGGAVCGPRGLCVVRPGARKSPAVWCRACFDLDKKSICGAKTAPGAKAACERAIDDAVKACDNDACKAVRDAQTN